jgi:uroporphyrinogen-III synthase
MRSTDQRSNVPVAGPRSAGVARPLADRGVIVTRDEPTDGPLTVRLRALGAEVFRWPTVQIQPPRDPSPLTEALRRLESYDWVVFTSRHAVRAVTSLRRQPPSSVRVAAVGSATADALVEAGWQADIVPDAHGGSSLVAALAAHADLRRQRVLYPASAIARPTVREELTTLGAVVDQVTAYEVHDAPLDQGTCMETIDRGLAHAITLASPSALDGLRRALGEDACARILRSVAVAVIGPTTASSFAKRYGTEPVVATSGTLDALADAVVVALQE